MARLRESIYLIENAVAGGRCMVSPSVGRTWLDVHIEHGGLTLAQMTNIKVLLVSNEKTITLQEYKNGVELNEMNKRYKRAVKAGSLSFYFRKPELENEQQSMATALGTIGLLSVRIEFDIAAGTSPVIKAWGKKTANRPIWVGLLPFVANQNKGGQAQGDNHFDTIEKRDRICAIHVLNPDVEALELKLDDAIVYEMTRARADFDEEGGDRVPYASDYGWCIDFTLSGVIDEALVMQAENYQAQMMRLTATLGADAGSTTRILTEYLSTWASLSGSNVQRAA